MIALDDFFANFPDSRKLYEFVLEAMDRIGPAEVRIMKSQIVFRRKKDFAWVWMPGQYLKGHKQIAPLVLSLAFPERNLSPRWKEVVEPYPGRYMHHLELYSIEDIDEQARGWMKAAWDLSA